MSSNKLNELVAFLNKKELTVAFAESVTAGFVGCQFSKALKVSKVFKGSLVAYQEEIKTSLLKVSKNTLEKHSAESQEVTNEMAVGLKDLYEVDIAVAITGLANPGGSESPEKPVGTIFISIIYLNEHFQFRTLFSGNNNEIIAQTAQYVFEQMQRIVKG